MRIKPILLGGAILLLVAGFLMLKTYGGFPDVEESTTSETRKLPERQADDHKKQVILAEGVFHNMAHTGAGQVKIYVDSAGKHFLEFIEFETAPGKDLFVCLMPYGELPNLSKADHSAYIVAPLEEITGDQLYELPSKIDSTRCKEVMIWSRSSGVNYAKAVLRWH